VYAVGNAFTVTTVVLEQDVAVMVYLTVALPGLRPQNVPVEAPMVPIAGVRLLQVPPPVDELNVTQLPIHTCEGPVMTFGIGLMVTTPVRLQPPGEVYVTVAVPALLPVTAPEVVLSVMRLLAVLHEPPPGLEDSIVLLPWQMTIDGVPVIAVGNGFTVRIAV
jgi:hypothetical protein